MASAEVLQLRRERDAALSELEEKQALIDEMRKQSQAMETQSTMENEELRAKFEELQVALLREKEGGTELRQELSTVSQTLAVTTREAESRIKSAEKTLQDKIQECQLLVSHSIRGKKENERRCDPNNIPLSIESQAERRVEEKKYGER